MNGDNMEDYIPIAGPETSFEIASAIIIRTRRAEIKAAISKRLLFI
jgi:hypothetical protein